MTRQPRIVTLLKYEGAGGTRFGFRFWHRHQLYQAKGFRTEALALEAGRRERLRVEQGGWEARWGPLRPPRLTWEEALRRYAEAKAGKTDLERHALPRLQWWRRYFEGRGVPEVQLVTPDLLDRAKAALAAGGKRPATIRAYLSVLRALFSLAIRRWGAVTRNPVVAVDWPRAVSRPTRIPTAAERRRLVDVAEPPGLRQAIAMALYTSLRQGSLLRLTAEDFRLRRGAFRAVQKGDRELWLPVTPAIAELVRSCGVASGPLFRWPDGQPMRRFPQKAWKRATAAAGVPWLTFHALRHCAGTVLADAGIPQRQIQAYLGHSSGAMTERYTQSVELRRAAKALEQNLGIGKRTQTRTQKPRTIRKQ